MAGASRSGGPLRGCLWKRLAPRTFFKVYGEASRLPCGPILRRTSAQRGRARAAYSINGAAVTAASAPTFIPCFVFRPQSW